jgi:hypothetical protein
VEVESPGENKDVQNGRKIKCNKCDEPYEWKKNYEKLAAGRRDRRKQLRKKYKIRVEEISQ